jgi:heat shock protein HspQ
LPQHGVPIRKGRRPLAHEFRFAKARLCMALDLPVNWSDIVYMNYETPHSPVAPPIAKAQFSIGEVVRHRIFEFRGVIFDVDPVFANSEEWYQSIPEAVRPTKDQPFYHLFAENSESSYLAYVSQQNLLPDSDAGPVNHPEIENYFGKWSGSHYELKREMRH